MKKNITIDVDSEKLSALNMFLKQKNIDFEKELNGYVEQLYVKNVPQNVRDFISQNETDKAEKPSRREKKQQAANQPKQTA
jgi:membrane-bound lytic murein transglycosylase